MKTLATKTFEKWNEYASQDSWSWRGFFKTNRFQLVLFFSLMMISSVPILGMTIWVERSAVDKEFQSVSEKHLMVAKSISLALSRYAADIENMVNMLANMGQFKDDYSSVSKTYFSASDGLAGLNLSYIAVIDKNDTADIKLVGTGVSTKLPGPLLLSRLKDLASAANGSVVISDLERFEGQAFFFVLKSLAGDRFLLAPLSPNYIRFIQGAVAFGDNGHAMVVDAKGRVVAHPNPQWQETSKDASKILAVKKMMARETGVVEFYAPPIKANVIAGHTFVPETGWGVMVPQPVSELISHAREVQLAGLIIAAISLLLSIIVSWWLSKVFSKPIHSISDVAMRISLGDRIARAELSRFGVPNDLELLANSFNEMVEELQSKSDQLSVALAQAESGSLAKSNFMATISHELRTPINGVIGLLEILEDTPLDTQQQTFVSTCRTSAGHLIQIVDDILQFTQTENGTVKLALEQTDVRELLSEIEKLFLAVSQKKAISLIAEVDTSVPKIFESDPHRLRQILINIIGNALKFTDEGGVAINVTCESNDGTADWVEIAVTDTGVGILEDETLDLFEAFSQGDNSYSRQYGGSGLGLAISKRFVEMLGGEIWYTSQLGSGTTFFIKLPINPEGETDD